MTEQTTEKEYIRKLFLDEEEQKAYLQAHRLRGQHGDNRRLIQEELEERIKDICGEEVNSGSDKGGYENMRNVHQVGAES